MVTHPAKSGRYSSKFHKIRFFFLGSKEIETVRPSQDTMGVTRSRCYILSFLGESNLLYILIGNLRTVWSILKHPQPSG